ncbi:Phosphatidylinositol 3-phosphate-binding protein 2 [Candida viswanathii]|uniref:Phosphatidylinositol 3-phosphate-binding protein 2 n=1 Tax=Candida viswanathii TaxID=5486 RepID=A0A367XN09_9ASCO|nr:Phosphatidylinositol 3-phosphate-binding protein 2 [Candida viswanathii]
MSTTTSINTIENTNNNTLTTTTTANNNTTSTNFTIKANLDKPAQANEEAITSITDKPSEAMNSTTNNNTTAKEESVESPTNLSFTKKDLSKSRTQSFQSVLSTASLKSLHQQALTNPIINNNTNGSNTPSHGLTRNNSTISTNNNLNGSNAKNFQSFIQAPVLSCIQKNDDDYKIGQQQSFDDKSSTTRKPTSTIQTSDDDDNLVQQKNLTLNALKKLSMSPRPVTNPDENIDQKKDGGSNEDNGVHTKTKEPYQPAEVDLSSFASLTRQPKLHHKLPSPAIGSANNSNTNVDQSFRRQSKESVDSNISQYHNDLQQHQLSAIQRQLQPEKLNTSSNFGRGKPPHHHHPQQTSSPQVYTNFPQQLQLHHQGGIPAAVVPPSDLSAKRKPLNPGLSKIPLQQQLPPQHLAQQQQQQQFATAAGIASLTPGSPSQQQHQHQLNHPRSSKHLQQIKCLRNPMYVPAVLRMTQNGLSTPNRSTSNSPDVIANTHSTTVSPTAPHPTQPSIHDHYESHLHDFGKRESIQNSSNASINSIDSGMSMDSNTSITSGLTGFLSPFNNNNNSSTTSYDFVLRAPPTRKHWIKDETVLKCSIPSCPKVFNFFERRHHCRKCGGIFCKQHTSHSLYINHLAQFTTGGRGTLSKVCDNCIAEYNHKFITKEFGVNIIQKNEEMNKANGAASVDVASRQSNPATYNPISSETGMDIVSSNNSPANTTTNSNTAHNNTNRGEQLVGSVPANWTWSSF